MQLSQSTLAQIAADCSERVRTAAPGCAFFDTPYKHLVLDDFLPVDFASRCLENFPAADASVWESANDEDIEVKLRSNWKSEFDIPDYIVDAVRLLNSAPFLHAMAARFDIPKIMPDPYFSGGGLNITQRGGLLDVHVDGNYHDASGLNRRLNALLYLNPDWEESWGGEFGIYDETGRHCLKKIAPLHNRLVIFDSHDKSFHGLPEPVGFPEDRPRRSIILYYYTKEPRPAGQITVEEPHSALWVRRNLHDKRGNKTRSFT